MPNQHSLALSIFHEVVVHYLNGFYVLPYIVVVEDRLLLVKLHFSSKLQPIVVYLMPLQDLNHLKSQFQLLSSAIDHGNEHLLEQHQLDIAQHEASNNGVIVG